MLLGRSERALFMSFAHLRCRRSAISASERKPTSLYSGLCGTSASPCCQLLSAPTVLSAVVSAVASAEAGMAAVRVLFAGCSWAMDLRIYNEVW